MSFELGIFSASLGLILEKYSQKLPTISIGASHTAFPIINEEGRSEVFFL